MANIYGWEINSDEIIGFSPIFQKIIDQVYVSFQVDIVMKSAPVVTIKTNANMSIEAEKLSKELNRLKDHLRHLCKEKNWPLPEWLQEYSKKINNPPEA